MVSSDERSSAKTNNDEERRTEKEATPTLTDVGKQLEGIMVTRFHDQAQVRLGDLWKDQGVLFCLLRRWGCGVCRLCAVNISSLKPILDEHSIALVGIGKDDIGLEEFYLENFFAGPIHVDAAAKSFKALECKRNSWRNFWGLLDSSVIKLAKASEAKGYKSNLKGDINQLGGTFLIAKGGQTLYAHRQTNDSFEPDLKQIVQALGAKLPENFVFYPAKSSARSGL